MKSTLKIEIYPSVKSLNGRWDELNRGGNIFLHYSYLQAVEECPPRGMSFRYAVISDHDRVVGIVYTQILYFNGGESIRYYNGQAAPRCFFQALGKNIKGLVARQVGFNTLICGNLMLAGEHGYIVEEGYDSAYIIQSALKAVQESLESEGIHISVILLKDFKTGSGPSRKKLQDWRYHAFRILPSMQMRLDEKWNTYPDYLNALRSKYRVRANKARKCLQEGKIRTQEMHLDHLSKYKDQMHSLYAQVVDDSGFNTIQLEKDFFSTIKKHLQDDCSILGYFDGDNLIGFLTAIRNGKELEAHFIGYDIHLNPSYKLYLNLLLDYITIGLSWGCESIQFARTATEIKSSIGAFPVEMTCYIRHRNHFSNKFIRPLLDYLQEEEEAIIRHPFKTNVPDVISQD